MKFTKILTISVIMIGAIISMYYFTSEPNLIEDVEKNQNNQKNIIFNLDYNPGGNRKNLDVSEIFLQYSYEEDQKIDGSYRYSWFEAKTEALSIINELKNESEKTVVVLPVFTHTAYSPFGFYDYFNQKCTEKCLQVKIERGKLTPLGNAGKNAIQILHALNYNFISDIDIDLNPKILLNYDKVILLHNEYVTKKEFEAITNHPKVMYLYPNALYAEIHYDSINDTISLIKGHGYPESSIGNGFEWEFENTHPYEYDVDCNDWEFYEIKNGQMLNCYPEEKIWKDKLLLKTIKEF